MNKTSRKFILSILLTAASVVVPIVFRIMEVDTNVTLAVLAFLGAIGAASNIVAFKQKQAEECRYPAPERKEKQINGPN